MKKVLKMLLVSALVATLFSSVALAEVNIGAWGRALFAPVAEEGGEIGPARGTSWGGDQRIGFTVAGNSDNIGFQVDFHSDANNNHGDQRFVWAKPMDMIKLSVGYRVFMDKYRGNSTFGSWNWMRPTGVEGEDNIFQRVGINDGAILEITPIAGLGIFAGFGDTREEWRDNGAGGPGTLGVDGTYTTTDADGDGNADGGDPMTTANMISLGQYGAGYDIAGVGTIRAQYIGRRDVASDTDYGIINAAVKIDKIMPAPYADLGFFTSTDSDMANNSWNSNTAVAAYVKYAMAPMTIHFLADITLDKQEFGGTADDKVMAMHIGVGLGYDLGNGMGAEVDVRYNDENQAQIKDGAISAMAGVTQGFSNGLFGAAFQMTTQGSLNGLDNKDGAVDDMQWALPIRVEYWF